MHRQTHWRCEQGLEADLPQTDLWTSTNPKLGFKPLQHQLGVVPYFVQGWDFPLSEDAYFVQKVPWVQLWPYKHHHHKL